MSFYYLAITLCVITYIYRHAPLYVGFNWRYTVDRENGVKPSTEEDIAATAMDDDM